MNLSCASLFVTETKENCIFILVLIIMAGGCAFSFFGLDSIGKTAYGLDWIGLTGGDWGQISDIKRYRGHEFKMCI